MNHKHSGALSPTLKIATRPRRGAAYVLVLCAGILLSVVGMGILASSRANSRTASQSADLAEASVLAESAVEWGQAVINTNSSWRTTYSNNVETTPQTLGRGQISFKLVNETTASLASGDVRIYGIGRVGSATRVYSFALVGTGPTLDVLKTAATAGGNVTVNSSLTASAGSLASNGTLTVATGVTLTGDVEASTVTVNGTVTGTRTTLTTPKSLPVSTVFDTYKAQATEMLFSGIVGGNVSLKVISAGANPYGSVNAAGVYYIHVPSTGTLTIKNSRLLATLVIELDSGGKLITSNSFAWDPPRTDFPTLIVKGTTGSTVTFGGSTTALSESLNLVNFNPVGTPNAAGVSDSDMSDTYPTEFHGLLHVIGSGLSTAFTNNFVMKGSAIIEGAATTGLGVKFTADPTLFTTPPIGYTAATTTVKPSSGSWRWEKTP